MKRHRVTSMTFASLGYDPARSVLEAEFCSGGIYDYYAVPNAVWRQFYEAPSKGEFFAAHIRDQYAFRKID